MSDIKKGKFIYKNEDSMKKMHEFYDKTLASNERAAEIAVQKVRDYRTETNSSIEVIFNV
ncbi:hypothetical protein [Butyrivibrio sp. NC3005]|uniref:hypothetical protein n=1 Tax=Butyrivibrio sp. NC3005 TaxID=1280685 RepID=UPI0004087394|nr:hypothetical protein [Butyrivibrio sp. NC3005]